MKKTISKKITKIVLLAIFIIILTLSSCTLQDKSEKEFKKVPNNNYEEEIEMLQALPYISYSENDADLSKIGVTYYNPAKSFDGLNFYEGKLLDMEGNIIHKWNQTINIDFLLPNGNILGYTQKNGNNYITRMDWEGNIIWEQKIRAHHELRLSPEKNSLFLFSEKIYEYNDKDVEFDTIIEMNLSTGRLINSWSTFDKLEYFEKYVGIIIYNENVTNPNVGFGADEEYYHANTINFVPENNREGEDKLFTPGNLIITFRHGNIALILDRYTREVLWYFNDLEGPHSTFMDKEGNIIIHDNGFYKKKTRIIKINPLNKNIIWQFDETNLQAPLFTPTKGCVEEMPNGNYLITESDNGHVFEVTPDKEVVWEFWNPEIPESGRFQGKRKSIYRTHRYALNYFDQEIQNKILAEIN